LSQLNKIHTNNQGHTSEARVIKQLIEALLFEGIVDFNYQKGLFTFKLNKQNYRATGKISGFGRIRLNANSISSQQQNGWGSPDLSVLVAQLPTSEALQEKLLIQLKQTIKLCQWNNQHLDKLKNRRALDYTQLESAIDEGHPYHPCFKARTGFSVQDHQNYGPEAANTFQLHWLAVKREYLKQNLSELDEQSFWQQELDEQTRELLEQRLIEAGGNEQTYSLLPMHPWQWNNLQAQLVTALDDKHLLNLGIAGDSYQASISVRTLLNVSQPNKANVKLPLNMINTSSLRTLESHSICTAPVLSQWLTQLISSDNYLQQHLEILPEYAGIRLTSQAHESNHAWLHALDGQLGVIFRQSLMITNNAQQVIPFVALALVENDGLPFIDPWIKQYGCQAWLDKLIDTAILPIWHLLVHHGIALEAHAQNLILSHQQGWPTKIILRDFHESLEYVPSYLSNKQLTPDFLALEHVYNNAAPDQYYWMENVEALRELLVDTLFVYNLTDLATLLEDHYQFDESTFWEQVYQGFNRYQANNHSSLARIEEMDIHQQNIQTESLIKRKLSTTTETEFHHSVSNPLAKTTTNITAASAVKKRSVTC
jgi:siderophore synthetase component